MRRSSSVRFHELSGTCLLPRNHLIKFDVNSNIPKIKVKCSNSRLSHTKMISRCVAEVVNVYKMNVLNVEGDTPATTDTEVTEPAPPLDLDISIIGNTCRILANVSGPLDHRFYLSDTEKLPILPTIASAVLSHILETNSEDLSQTTIWDPFCSNGVVLLELYSLLSGIPSGSPNIDYPLKTMPFNDEYDMNKSVDKLSIKPLDVGYDITLLGCDSNPDHVLTASGNLSRFEALSPKMNIPGSKPQCGLRFENSGLEETLKNLGKSLLITNFVYGDKDSEEAVVSAYKRLSDIIKAKGDWIDLYVISGRSSFHRHTNLNWHKEMNFNNQGIKCELLRLAK